MGAQGPGLLPGAPCTPRLPRRTRSPHRHQPHLGDPAPRRGTGSGATGGVPHWLRTPVSPTAGPESPWGAMDLRTSDARMLLGSQPKGPSVPWTRAVGWCEGPMPPAPQQGPPHPRAHPDPELRPPFQGCGSPKFSPPQRSLVARAEEGFRAAWSPGRCCSNISPLPPAGPLNSGAISSGLSTQRTSPRLHPVPSRPHPEAGFRSHVAPRSADHPRVPHLCEPPGATARVTTNLAVENHTGLVTPHVPRGPRRPAPAPPTAFWGSRPLLRPHCQQRGVCPSLGGPPGTQGLDQVPLLQEVTRPSSRDQDGDVCRGLRGHYPEGSSCFLAARSRRGLAPQPQP